MVLRVVYCNFSYVNRVVIGMTETRGNRIEVIVLVTIQRGIVMYENPSLFFLTIVSDIADKMVVHSNQWCSMTDVVPGGGVQPRRLLIEITIFNRD
jgi:hypothetical protein